MPDLAIAAGITAAGALAGGKMQSNSADKARKSQLAANDAALAYQKEQDAKAEARARELEAAERAAWEAEQARLAPLRALKESLAGQTANRIGLPFNTSTLGEAKPYPGSGANMGSSVSPISTLSSLRGTGVSRGTPAVSPAMPDPADISEQDPYTTSSLRLADIARGGWRL